MSAPGVYHALLLSYGRAALDSAYVRPMSADVNYGTTTDLNAPAPGVHEVINAWGDFYCARTGNTARRFNVLDLSGAVKDTYTKVSWGFIPCGIYSQPFVSWDFARAGWYSNYGGEMGLMLPGGTFTTYAPGENIVGVNGGVSSGNAGFQILAIGDQTSTSRLRRMALSGGALVDIQLEATGDTYRFFNGAQRLNPERVYLQTGASNNNIKYYSYLSDSLVTVASNITPAMANRGVTGLRQYNDPTDARVGFDSDLWTAHNGTPAIVTQRDGSVEMAGAILHTVTLPSGYNTIASNAPLYVGPDGKVWVHATNGVTPKMFACRANSSVPVAESPALLNGRWPMGITANNYMAFHHSIGSSLYYSLMKC